MLWVMPLVWQVQDIMDLVKEEMHILSRVEQPGGLPPTREPLSMVPLDPSCRLGLWGRPDSDANVKVPSTRTSAAWMAFWIAKC